MKGREREYSLTVERNMMMNPANMGMWYPILKREEMVKNSRRVSHSRSRTFFVLAPKRYCIYENECVSMYMYE